MNPGGFIPVRSNPGAAVRTNPGATLARSTVCFVFAAIPARTNPACALSVPELPNDLALSGGQEMGRFADVHENFETTLPSLEAAAGGQEMGRAAPTVHDERRVVS